MKRKIIFRADASKSTGYGHFIRSLALAEYLRDDFDCHFFSYNQNEQKEGTNDNGGITDYQLNEILKRKITPGTIQAGSVDEFNKKFLEQLTTDDIVVLDNYYYSTEYQQAVKNRAYRLVCIDDVHNRHMVCDLLMTSCPLTREDFSTESYTRFVGGIEWAFLRSPFLMPVKERLNRKEIHRIIIAMGGADAFNLTDKMIGIVSKVFSEAVIDVICGETVIIRDYDRRNVNIHRMISAQEIANLMDNADIGIFPASTIVIEALSRELPPITGYYVDNQTELYNFGVANGYFTGIGNLLDDAGKIEGRLRGIPADFPTETRKVDFASQKGKIIELFKAL
ncbi:MAG: pseudaminic acid biosynthesis protein PseG [Paramuribaculum sp.]|nr:pseudaminic acid biosynthesis protein PseG [Paramuribaculum sp.]